MSSIKIEKLSIVSLTTDAIVNAANEDLWMGGGVCGAIFRAAGAKKLMKACQKIGHCDTGNAVITKGFDLKAKYIIHAVGPIWDGGTRGEKELLAGAYKNSLRVAKENKCHSIGFPLISAGIFGYPKEEAWQVAIDTCKKFIDENEDHEMDIIFAVLDDEIKAIGESLLSGK